MEHRILALLLVILLLIYWQIFLPGSKVATDFPLVSTNSLKSQFDIPRSWNDDGTDGLGQNVGFTLWSWPLSFLSGALASFNLGFSFQERALYLIPFLLMGGWGIWRLCKYLSLSNKASFISSIFYLANTYILLIIDGGQLRIALAYGILPGCFLLIEKAVHNRLTSKILAALSIVLLGFFDIRFIYILFMLTFLRFIYSLVFDLRN